MSWPTGKNLRDALNAALRTFVAALLALLVGAQAGVVQPGGLQPAALSASCSNNLE